MPWIPIVPRADANPALAAAYDAVSGARGTVANIMGVHSVHPEAMTAHLRLYAELMFAPSELTRAERETVAVAVSRANHCFYCITHHAAALHRLVRDDVLVDALAADPDGAPLGARARAFVTYALKLTRTPHAVVESDLAPLRAVGLSDGGLHDLVAVAAYFNFVNRLAAGLGVELETTP